MRKRQELEEADSCLNRAADDEPLFVLRANDPLFATLVRAWASKYCARKIKARCWREREAVKHLEALNIAQEGEQWLAARARRHEAERPPLSLRELLARWKQRERERLALEAAQRELEQKLGGKGSA